jgi:polyhydroxyalkanoate synthesis regulator phasin
MADDQRRPRDAGDHFREAVRSISGVLGALKESLEATFDDLREQGEFTPEKAREAASNTFRKAQEAVDEMRGRIEFVSRREFDELRDEVAALRARLDAESGAGASATTDPAGASTDVHDSPPDAPTKEGTDPAAEPRFRLDVE